jgi:3-oxoacyl-[acyl-carrier protein] reductase
MNDLTGKNAIITGASRGIGKAIALKLAHKGVNLILAARNKQVLEESVNHIKNQSDIKVIGISTDVGIFKRIRRYRYSH